HIESRLHKPKVLLVDDSAEQLLLLKSVLETKGYDVVTANSGVEAIGIFAGHEFDVVVLDYNMPDIDGGMLAGRMKQHNFGMPILMFSGMDIIPRRALRHVDLLVRKGDKANALADAIASVLPAELVPSNT